MVIVVEPADVFAAVGDGSRVSRHSSGGILRLPAPDLGHHPRTRDHRMRLQELFRSRALHFGGNDAEQVIFHPYAVDGGHFPAFHDEARRTGELLHLLALPVEVYADRDVMQDEGRLGEEGRGRHGVKDQFVVKHPVIVDTPVGITDDLRAGAVGDDFESDFLGRHDADVQGALAAGQTPDDPVFHFRRQTDLLQHLMQDVRIQAPELIFDRTDKEARDIGATDAHREMLLSLGIEVMGAQFTPENDQRTVFAAGMPAQHVETRLLLAGQDGHAVQQAVEKLGGRLGGLGAEQEHATREFPVMIEPRILHVGQVMQGIRPFPDLQAHGALQRHQPGRAGLEMHVVRFGGAAPGTIIKNGVAFQVAGQVQHIHVTVPDGLVHMAVTGNDQMVRKNGIRVDPDAVEPSFAAFEAKMRLLRRPVFLAEEASLRGEFLIRVPGQRGLDAGRVALRLDRNAAHGQILDQRRLEGAEMIGGQRPDRQLVCQELFDRESVVHLRRGRAMIVREGPGGHGPPAGIRFQNWGSVFPCQGLLRSPLPSSTAPRPPRR